MPIVMVRWPDLSASLVQAEGEEHLLDILDQVGNADNCEWSIYDVPLFIDFRLAVQWLIEEPAAIQGNPRRVVIGDIGELAGGNIIENMQLSLAEGDDGYETGAAVLRLAFPKLHAAMEDDAGDEPTGRDQSVAEAGGFGERCTLNLTGASTHPRHTPNLKRTPTLFPGSQAPWTCRSNLPVSSTRWRRSTKAVSLMRRTSCKTDRRWVRRFSEYPITTLTSADSRPLSTEMNRPSITATSPIGMVSRLFSSTIPTLTKLLSGWGMPVGITCTASWMAVWKASSLTKRRPHGFAPAGSPPPKGSDHRRKRIVGIGDSRNKQGVWLQDSGGSTGELRAAFNM